MHTKKTPHIFFDFSFDKACTKINPLYICSPLAETLEMTR